MGSDSKEGQHLPSEVQRLLDSRTFKHLNVTSSLVATALTVMLIATFFFPLLWPISLQGSVLTVREAVKAVQRE